MLGRSFTAEDDRRGGGPNGPVAGISHTFWQRRFSGSADVIGKTQSIDPGTTVMRRGGRPGLNPFLPVARSETSNYLRCASR